jgi:hypothetical protein
MSSDKDYDYIAKLEKAISEKYGKEAIENPKNFWTKEKEEKYLKELKEFYRKEREKRESEEKERRGDVLISKKFLENSTSRNCPVCDKYSFDKRDDLYMNKFECCFGCYVQHIEGRERRWREGWRPDKNTMAIIK